ncbi:conserved hypothetical protein [Ahrensia sp. R2A130]|nr:conserved hypothetical protein [Ahrensia sp. R2A130]
MHVQNCLNSEQAARSPVGLPERRATGAYAARPRSEGRSPTA